MADKLLEDIHAFVLPFNQPTDNEVEKAFKKVKKLKMPTWSEYDLRDLSYVGWNDKGTQRKYIMLNQNGQLIGYSGTISPNIQRSVCAICQLLRKSPSEDTLNKWRQILKSNNEPRLIEAGLNILGKFGNQNDTPLVINTLNLRVLSPFFSSKAIALEIL